MRLAPSSCRKKNATETNTCLKTHLKQNSRLNQVEEPMKRAGQTHKEAGAPINLLFPKTLTKIGCWNVRTLYETGRAAQVAMEMDKYQIDILELSEVRWTTSGKVTLASGHTLIYSGPPNEEDEHRGVMRGGTDDDKESSSMSTRMGANKSKISLQISQSDHHPILCTNKSSRIRHKRPVIPTAAGNN